MEQLDFTMIEINEHEFIKNDIKIGFAFTEDLLEYADIEYTSLKVFEDNQAKYQLLTITDYLKVYNKSLQDGYRKTKNNNKDLHKILVLKKLVQD